MVADLGARGIQGWLNRSAKLISKTVDPNTLSADNLKDIVFLETIGVMKAQKKPSILECAEIDAALADEQATKELFIPALPKTNPEQLTTVIWTSPLGLPIVQPYRNQPTKEVKTHLQSFSLLDHSKMFPVNVLKQASAFPPNFIHSLDASHMMLSCLDAQDHGIRFAAVHDSYWTHACDIDTLSKVLREAFITLHSQDLLQRLFREFIHRYGQLRVEQTITLEGENAAAWFAHKQLNGRRLKTTKPTYKVKTWVLFSDLLESVPERGEFDIQKVRDSEYFFH